MRMSLKLAGIAALLAASTAHAQAIGRVVDAANFVMDTSSGLGVGIGGAGVDEILAQTLTVEVGGTLVGLFLPIQCGTGKLRVEIHDVVGGLPGPNVLAARNAPVAEFPYFGRFTWVPIPGALALTAGQQISFVLENKKGGCLMTQSSVAANYPGGRAYFDARPNPVGVWVATGDFANTPDDWPFQLVVDP